MTADRLNRLLARHGVAAAALARRLGVSEGLVSRWRTGERRIISDQDVERAIREIAWADQLRSALRPVIDVMARQAVNTSK